MCLTLHALCAPAPHQAIITKEEGGHASSVHALAVISNLMFSGDREGNIIVSQALCMIRVQGYSGLTILYNLLGSVCVATSRDPSMTFLYR